jgi:Ran GTPase-activating protein 1
MAPESHILSLQSRGLKLDTRSDIEPFLKDLDPTTIEEIHFGGNTIGVDASKALAEFLEKTTRLKASRSLLPHFTVIQTTSIQIADFADIFTGRLISEIPLSLTAICDALKEKTTLVELNLSDNAFGGRSVDPMVPFLTRNRSFQVLKLNNNGLGPAGGAILAEALLESARLSKAEGKTSNLRTIICGRNRLEDGSAPVWAKAFAAHGMLVDVRMPQNGIRMDGIIALADGLSRCPNLQHLDLQDNTFTADGSFSGVKAWTEALRSWPALKTLNLSDCVLSVDGEAPLLIAALSTGSNPNLHTLQLQNNNLDTQSFALLAQGITSHLRSLMSLELQWNEIEDDDEHLETLGDSMKQRGGKLFVSDEDEDTDLDESKDADEGAGEGDPDTDGVDANTKEDGRAADALADLMSKVDLS